MCRNLAKNFILFFFFKVTHFGNGADGNSCQPPRPPQSKEFLKVILEEEKTSLVPDIYGSAEYDKQDIAQ